MDPIERSKCLRQEADQVIQAIGLRQILASCGPIVWTGSYFLDVMIYPDIDLYIALLSIEVLFAIAGQLAASELVAEVVFQRSTDETLPGGLYLKLRIRYGNWERPWKIDIWSLDEAVTAEKMRDMHRFRDAMTATLHDQIIRCKYALLTPSGRTPMYSGYHIYRAFINEGLTDHEEVKRYLLANGVKLS